MKAKVKYDMQPLEGSGYNKADGFPSHSSRQVRHPSLSISASCGVGGQVRTCGI